MAVLPAGVGVGQPDEEQQQQQPHKPTVDSQRCHKSRQDYPATGPSLLAAPWCIIYIQTVTDLEISASTMELNFLLDYKIRFDWH